MRLNPFYTEYCFIGNNVIIRFQYVTMKVTLLIGSLLNTLYLIFLELIQYGVHF